MIKLRISILIISNFFILHLYTQPFHQEWVEHYYSNHGDDEQTDMLLDNSGNIYVSGISYLGYPNPNVYSLIKYSPSGTQQWLRQFGGSGGILFTCKMAKDDSDNFFIATTQYDGNYSNYEIFKYDKSGNQLWDKVYNGPANDTDVPKAITVDKNSNVYVTGMSVGTGTHLDYCTIKYNSAGTQLWVARYNSKINGIDIPHSITVDESGNVFVTGQTEMVASTSEIATIKYNSSGEQQWIQFYNGNVIYPNFSGNGGLGICLDKNKNVYITGNCTNIPGGEDCVTIKYSASGVQQWIDIFSSGVGADYGTNIVFNDSGFIYVCGGTYVGSRTTFLILKYDTNGTRQWYRIYLDSLSQSGYGDNVNSMALDKYGNVYLAGTFYYNYLNSDYGTIKYTPNGELKWVLTYDGGDSLHDGAGSVLIDTTGNVYISGSSTIFSTGFRITTLKYSQPLFNIRKIRNKIPVNFRLYQNYPNPFNSSTKIKFEIPEIKNHKFEIRLVIYDILGKELTNLMDGTLSQGTYEIEWNGNNYTSGLYFYTLILDDKNIETKKLILLK